jgi:hypothetical protein
MPTYEVGPEFLRDWRRLTPEQRARFKDARDRFVSDLKQGAQLRSGFRIKKFRGQKDVWEFSYEGDGRALFMYGTVHVWHFTGSRRNTYHLASYRYARDLQAALDHRLNDISRDV